MSQNGSSSGVHPTAATWEPPPLPVTDLSMNFKDLNKNINSAKNLTDHLDAFMTAQGNVGRVEYMLQYLQSLAASVDNSMLLQAEIAYLYFADTNCPVLYGAEQGTWFVWSTRGWSSFDSMTRVMEVFQTGYLHAIRDLRSVARTRDIFPNDPDDGEEHLRMKFICKLISTVENKIQLKAFIEQCANFFRRDALFDTNSIILQLRNCVLDLSTNCFRYSSPADMTSRSEGCLALDRPTSKPSRRTVRQTLHIRQVFFCKDSVRI